MVNYTSISKYTQVLSPVALSYHINVMSVNFFADTIAATTSNINNSNSSSTSSSAHSAKVASGHQYQREEETSFLQSKDYNSMSNKSVATQALMDTSGYQHHQEQKGRQGTPDANTYASNMSSDSINNNNISNNQDQHQQQVNTSKMANNNLSAQDLFSHLHEALALEPKYQPNLFLPQQSNVSNQATYMLPLFFLFFFSFNADIIISFFILFLNVIVPLTFILFINSLTFIYTLPSFPTRNLI